MTQLRRQDELSHSLSLALILISLVGCGGSPKGPSAPSDQSRPLHDTLNAAGSAAITDGVTSERSGGFDQQVFDDFVSPTAALIRTVVWQGIRPTARPPARFYLAFIADDGGHPLWQYDPNAGRLSALYAALYTIDQVNERGGVTQACDNSPQQQCGSYDYSVTLPAPFSPTPERRYWLLIQAESPSGSFSGWLWRKGRMDNGFSLSTIASTIFPWDFAFALRP